MGLKGEIVEIHKEVDQYNQESYVVLIVTKTKPDLKMGDCEVKQ